MNFPYICSVIAENKAKTYDMAKMNLIDLYQQIMGHTSDSSQQGTEQMRFEYPSIYEQGEYRTTTLEHLTSICR